jgi:hypothetical protein
MDELKGFIQDEFKKLNKRLDQLEDAIKPMLSGKSNETSNELLEAKLLLLESRCLRLEQKLRRYDLESFSRISNLIQMVAEQEGMTDDTLIRDLWMLREERRRLNSGKKSSCSV